MKIGCWFNSGNLKEGGSEETLIFLAMSCEGTWLVTKQISASRAGLASTRSPADFLAKRPPYMSLQACPGFPFTFYQRQAHPQPCFTCLTAERRIKVSYCLGGFSRTGGFERAEFDLLTATGLSKEGKSRRAIPALVPGRVCSTCKR